MKKKTKKFMIPKWAIMYLYKGSTKQEKEIEEIEEWKKENKILSFKSLTGYYSFDWYPIFGEYASYVVECIFFVEG